MDRDYCADLERMSDDIQRAARAALTEQNFDRYYRLNALSCRMMEAVHNFLMEPAIDNLNHFSKGFLERST
jgi:hypothetical protein